MYRYSGDKAMGTRVLRWWWVGLLFVVGVAHAQAPAVTDAGGMRAGRVLVVANAASPASLELAAAYRQARGLPAINAVMVKVSNPVAISPAEFVQAVLNPVLQRRAALGGAVDYVVLCRDVPYRVGEVSATTAIMFGGVGEIQPTQGYYQQEHAFDASLPHQYRKLLPGTVLSAYTVEEGLRLIRDSLVRYPDARQAGRFYFCDGAGPRGTRNRQIPEALALLAKVGAVGHRVEEPSLRATRDILGQFTGAEVLELAGNGYLPGSILDNLTSFGGYLLDNNGQSDLLNFVRYGVSGAYGTVSEPTNNPTRWCDYTLPARLVSGFNLAEAYLQTVLDWRVGVVVGDPLLAPYARPPVITLAPAKGTFAAGETPRVRVTLREGIPGKGIAGAELWLNDQDRLYAYTPRLPAGTEGVLALLQPGNRVLWERRVRYDREVTLADALAAFVSAAPANQPVEVERVGRHGDHLLLRWRPGEALPAGGVMCVLVFQAEGRTGTAAHALREVPVAVATAVLDFGADPLLPGDVVTISVGQGRFEIAAEEGEDLERLVRRVAERLSQLAEFGRDGVWRVGLRTQPGNPPLRTILIIYPTTLGQVAPLRLATAVRRTAGSTVAPRLAAAPEWRPLPALPLAEAVIQPVWPVAQVEEEVEIPRRLCAAGFNRVRLTAASPAGAREEAETTFMLAEPGCETQVAWDRATLNWREALSFRWSGGPALAGVNVELVVDGRPVTNWPAAAGAGQHRMVAPSAPPGRRQVWLQWTREDYLRSPFTKLYPLARTPPAEVWLRHPLAYGASLSPAEVTAGKPTSVELRGPYFRDGMTVLMDNQPVKVSRDGRRGLIWRVGLPAEIEPGPHTFQVEGDPERETGGLILPLLNVKPAPPPPPVPRPVPAA